MKKYFITAIIITMPLWSDVFYPIQDAYVFQNNPTGNYGTVGKLLIQSNLFDWNYITRSLIEFDLTSISQGTSILSATLNLYMFNQAGVDFEVEVRAVLEPWDETTVTWENQPIHDTDIVAILSYQGYGWWHFDVTGIVQLWVNEPDINHGVKLKFCIEQYLDSLGREADFYSRDTTLNQPYLEVLYAGIEEQTSDVVSDFTMTPNPIRGCASFILTVAEDIPINITLYDQTGRRVSEVYHGILHAGCREFMVDSRNLAAGTYLLKIDGENFSRVKLLVIIK